MTASEHPVHDELPGVRAFGLGAVAGAVAALLGYVLTYGWLAGRAVDVLVRHAPTYSIARDILPQHAGAIPTWKAVGWLFYNAHGDGVRFAIVGPGQTGPNYVDFLGAEGGLVSWLWLIPAFLVVVAGFLVAYSVAAPSPRAGLLSGASVAIGYAAVQFLGSTVLVVNIGQWQISAGGSLIGFVGLPMVMGGLGGLVAAAIRQPARTPA